MKKIFLLLLTGFISVFAGAQTLYWSGTHNWNATTLDWGTVSTGPYTTKAWTSGATGNFVGTAGTVTLAVANTIGTSANFTVTGYTLSENAADTLTSPIVLSNNVTLSLMPNVTTAFTQAGSITGGTGSGLTLSGTTLTAAKIVRINMYSPNTVISVPTTINLLGSASNANLVGVEGEAPGISISGGIGLSGTSGGGRAMFGALGNDTLNLSGKITGSADIQFSLGTNGGAGTVAFSNTANNFTGNLYMVAAAGGTVKTTLGSASCLPANVGLYYPTATYGGVFDINGVNDTISALSSTYGSVGGVTNNGTSSSLIVNQSINTGFGLVLSNGSSSQKLALTKSGTGVLTLSAVNTYTGATAVNAGSLFIDTGSLAAGSAVTVASGATIGGNGTAKGTLALSGTVSPGATGSGSVGTFTTGAQTWSTGAIYQCDIAAATGTAGTNWDLLSSNGNTNLSAGGFVLNVNGTGITGFSNIANYTWQIMNAGSITGYNSSAFTLNMSGFPAYTGSFSLVKSGATINLVYTPLPVAPLTQATNVSFSAVSYYGLTVNWTNGNGASRIAVIRPASVAAVAPVYGTAYAASIVYGTDSTGVGNYVIFNGTGSGPVTVSGLAGNTGYTVEVYEFNGGTGQQAYDTSSTAAGNPASTTTLIPVYYWNGGNPTSGSGVTANGGTAQWQVANAWVEPSNPGTGATWVDGNIAILGGTAGKVTLTQNQTVDSMQVNTTGYTFTQNSSSTFTGPINLATGVNLNVFPNITAATNYWGNITGDSTTGITLNSSNLAANKASKINLAQDNSTITVPVTVTLSSNDSTFGGFVSTGSNIIMSGPFNLNTLAGGGRTLLAATSGNSLRVTGPISGTGDIQFSDGLSGGTGNLYLEDTANNFTGDIYMAGGAGASFYAGKRNAGTGIPATARLFLGNKTGFGGFFDLNGNHVYVAGLETTAAGAVGGIINSGSTNRTLTITQVDTTVFGLPIEDGNNATTIVAKKGAGILTLSGANTFTGGLNIYGGTIQLGASNTLASGLPLGFNGGKFSTGSTTGYSQSLNTLQLTGNGTILLGTGAHTLSFVTSDTMSWTAGKTLIINNWTGTPGNAGTGGRIFVGTDATGLTAAQLDQIQFTGYLPGATILNTGELVPALGYVWLGNTSVNWNTASNWSSNLVPVSTSYVIIPSGTLYAPTILTGTASAENLVLNSGATLTINQGAILTVADSLTGGATSKATITGAGVLIMNGSFGQSVSGNLDIAELEIADTSDVSLSTGAVISIDNALDLQSGNFDVSQGSLTFTSASTTQSAILDNFSPGFTGTIGGSVNVQRAYQASTYFATKQHMLGLPVHGAATTLAQIGAGASSGPVTPQSDCDEYYVQAGSPYGNVFGLVEANGATCSMAQWYVEPSTVAAAAGAGYSVVLTGSGVLTVSGKADTASAYTLNGLSNSNWSNTTAEHHTMRSGWHLLSNPYLAPLVINTSGGTGVDAQVQVWDDNQGYSGSYQPNLGTGGKTVIAPFQAFLIHVSDPGTASYTISGADRSRTTPATFYSASANELDVVAENLDKHLLDKTVVAFNPAATDSFDPQFDADKLSGGRGRHNLYTTLPDGQWMGINTLHDVASTPTVPMGFEPAGSGNFSFTFNNINTFDPTTYIYLEDSQQQVMFNVRNGNYLFGADTNDNRDRFVLHFTPPVLINAIGANCDGLGAINVSQPGTANWNYSLADGNNAVISTGVLNLNNPLSVNAPAGTYTLTLTDNNNYTVTKQIVVNGALPVSAVFSPSANNVNTQTAVSFTNTSINANTFIWNFGDGSTSSLVSPVHAYTAAGVYTVQLTATNTSGCTATSSAAIHVINEATGNGWVTTGSAISLWSNRNTIYIDFTQSVNVDAVIKIYDVLGQQLSEDRFTLNALYQKEIDNVDAAYVIVAVNNHGTLTSKKLFINNVVR